MALGPWVLGRRAVVSGAPSGGRRGGALGLSTARAARGEGALSPCVSSSFSIFAQFRIFLPLTDLQNKVTAQKSCFLCPEIYATQTQSPRSSPLLVPRWAGRAEQNVCVRADLAETQRGSLQGAASRKLVLAGNSKAIL